MFLGHWGKQRIYPFRSHMAKVELRACADRDAMTLNGKRTQDARSSGESSKLPDEGAYARARTRTLPHRAHLATVFGPDTGKANDPPARVPPPPHPRSHVVFEKLVCKWVVFGCAYERIADCTSARPPRLGTDGMSGSS